MSRYAWGIDVGDGTLKAIRLKAKSKSLCVVQAIEIPYLDPFLEKKSAPSCLDRRAIAALYQLGSTTRIHYQDKVAVGFSSFHAFEGIIDLPRIEKDKRDEMIRYELSSHIILPLADLKITHCHHRLRSTDMEIALVHAAKKQEFKTFLHYIDESGIPYDRIVSSPAALVDMARLCFNFTSDYVVLSPGFNSTDIVLMRGSDFWTKTLPAGLPVAPGEAMNMAGEKMSVLCDSLASTLKTLADRIFPDQSFKPSKILVSGEGSRVPAFVNSLDAVMPAPVQVLRPTGSLLAVPSGNSLPATKEEIYSMGKAIGLAKGALEESRAACVLCGPQPVRTLRRKLPVVSAACTLLFVLVLGCAFLEIIRSSRLEELASWVDAIGPKRSIEELDKLLDRTEHLRSELEVLEKAHVARGWLRALSKLLARVEKVPVSDASGGFHILNLNLNFEDGMTVESLVATRRGSGEDVKKELASLFASICPSVHITGPSPGKEETPPEGMAPLVNFQVADRRR